MSKEEILKILEDAKDKNSDVPMRLVRQAFEKLPEPCEDAVSRADVEAEIANILKNVFVEYQDIAKKAVAKLPSVTPKLPECEDAVSRKAVEEAIISKPAYHNSEGSWYHGSDIRMAIDALPSVTPKRKTGKWIEHSFSEDGKTRLIECSECGAAYTVNCLCDYSIFVEERRYCNKCGAKMEVIE